jgi:Domain of unknown function (DUF4386)
MLETPTTTANSAEPASVAQTPARPWAVLPALVAIGPLAIAFLRFVMPYYTADDAQQIVRDTVAHPSNQSAVIWLGLIAIYAMVPAAVWVGRFARRWSPRLATAAIILMVAGYLSLGSLLTSDVVMWTGTKVGLTADTITQLYNGLHPSLAVADAVFVAGHVLGTILLGLALWRSPVVPRWLAVVCLVCQPLHFVAAVIVSSHPLDLFAWALNALVFAAVAVIARREWR